MINRPMTVAALHEWMKELTTKSKDWWTNQENQLEVLTLVDFYRKIMSPVILGRLSSMMSVNSGINPARVDAILRLDRIDDIRRAIKWPGPLPIDRTEEHTELYPMEGWIGEYLHYSQGSEIPMAWHFWFGVALIGAACRRNIDFDNGTFRVFTYWYLMIIEETASAKSTAFSIALDMLSRVCTKLENSGRIDRVIQIGSQSSTLPAFLDQVKTQAFLSILPDGSQLSGTTEACAVIPVDELVSLLGESKHNPAEWIGFLTDMFGYTRHSWKDSTVTSKDRILVRPAINFWGGTTLEWIKSSVTNDMFKGGFLGRFIFIKRRGDEKSIPRPHILDPVWAESLADYLVELAKMDPMEFELTQETAEWHDNWYHENKAKVKRFQGDNFQAYFKRKQSHLIRLAMCMSIAEGRFYCDLKTIQLANKILSIEEEPMAWIFNDLGSHPDKTLCDYLLQMIGKGMGAPVLYSKLLRDVRHRTGSTQKTKELLQTLVNAGEVEVGRGKNGGVTYRVSAVAPKIPDATVEIPS